ncbi:hypothetical protein KDA_06890 [Dictyobacter alpinus]|uniref:Uncharacterized protein n=1 Tax=Dictyobacter alpinus TaxID=2014873 RepID=A0A402B1F8_9CHLR|nr:hypothetical protein KDA_06890 [Dictyobacter alpinus]
MRTQPSRPITWNLSTIEWLLLGTIVCALLGGAYAFLAGQNIITLILALAGFVGIFLVMFSQFIFRARRVSSTRYGNIKITPLRRGPLSTLKTQWNLLILKLRYRRKDEQ